jgi:hypothetical protein
MKIDYSQNIPDRIWVSNVVYETSEGIELVCRSPGEDSCNEHKHWHDFPPAGTEVFFVRDD